MEIRRIPDHSPYEISEFGDVYRRLEDGTLRGPLKTTRHTRGYRLVKLGKPPCNTHTVHKLVALTFIGPRPDGMTVCHNDGSKVNNHHTNLRYDTPSNNTRDMADHGTKQFGELHANSRLTSTDVKIARMLCQPCNESTCRSVAVSLGVAPVTIRHAVTRKTWAHVT